MEGLPGRTRLSGKRPGCGRGEKNGERQMPSWSRNSGSRGRRFAQLANCGIAGLQVRLCEACSPAQKRDENLVIKKGGLEDESSL